MADLVRRGGRPAEAETFYREAGRLYRQLVADFPSRIDYRSALCVGQTDLGELLEETNRRAEAERAYREAWAVATGQVRSEARPLSYWFQRLDRCQDRLVKLLTAAGRTDEAEKHYREALAFWAKLAAQSPAVFKYHAAQAQTYDHLERFLRTSGRPQEAARAADQALAIRRRAIERGRASLAAGDAESHRQLAQALNNTAWHLITRPEVELRRPKLAVDLARQAVALLPDAGSAWNTLGIAHYCNGEWKEAITALDRKLKLQKWGTSWDYFFLAQAHGHLGHRDQAHAWYDRGVQWMQKNSPGETALQQLRAEAAELLGIDETPGPRKH